MFKEIECKVELSHLPFENLRYRDRTVLILGKDDQEKFILGDKKGFYPEGIVRMIGGGINDDEDVLSAAVRETEEELGIKEPVDRFVPLVQVNVEGAFEGEKFTHVVYVYFLPLTDKELVSGDDVSDVVRMDEKGYRQLVTNYFKLASDNFFEHQRGKFSWGDYGKVYGFIHEAALDEVLEKKL
ncbi:TPA: hypothetical protein DIU27_02470 [Candidatus Collierbacteria bacterium]|uniref:Nudix hydrolase domain-containing protein n=1 Tax=Candidatus Collierbacteria bacterium GW2011_GWB2_44_22 TaxID=1618387 RepID=A0A0G1HY30_9BACT|nr:MAG: hypothetical protein UW31_C0008G0024 [Candidatus Collierbacteria bacterium GW2011_GWA2_44_13]KKT50995.1 MAG: hypothetical protein UW42_C0010G0009 [Candidatus Collierbacteria bacterium GW2011_GWB1_44_197]KKT51513.1 MAG: hypothetical protein UW44_C0011G0024 [Candidatus Collierbacteria bacterium GW2011_GWB2_44_22]KKT62250.1 MAG: hypothetical protein UW56_C0009G0024 [Candidatus Collierbacteria bacterium GW2011_GWD1_44_27]KKT66791.1 MAG: hypothetical protein UW58_C0003G0024 [Candidatus Colli